MSWFDVLNWKRIARPLLTVSVVLWITGCSGYESSESNLVADGVVHRVLRVKNPPAVVNVIEVNLSANVSVRSVKAMGVISGLAKASEIWGRGDSIGDALVCVNGDFFSKEGRPIGPQVVGGRVVKTGSKKWPVLGFGEQPFIQTVGFTGHVIVDGAAFEIDNVNAFRRDSEIVFYNRYFGDDTRTNKYGVEIKVDSLFPGNYMVGDTILGVVTEIEDGTGSSRLTKGGAVLSAHGKKAQALLKLIAPGDTIRFCFRFPPVDGRISDLVGGFPKIVAAGRRVDGLDTLAGPVFVQERHPRTAAGFDANFRTLFLITVDGRQSGYSEGMTLDELADLMVSLGIHEGINLDGGGSTTMVVNGTVVNRPSDEEGERPVSNAIVVLAGKK